MITQRRISHSWDTRASSLPLQTRGDFVIAANAKSELIETDSVGMRCYNDLLSGGYFVLFDDYSHVYDFNLCRRDLGEVTDTKG